ncbi:MAG: CDP-glucose 4,6-dehydratase [Anaerolineales bacterium]|nr:CDP-glucose 4,6-dehydratase [Anaerolineales bacterium]
MKATATVSPDFWVGRKVLVTGHTGFKGAWLTAWLRQMGAACEGISLPPPHTLPSLFNLIGLDDEISSHFGDIRDFEWLKSAFEEAEPEIIFHLAAQSIVRLSYAKPLQTLSTNVMGTANLLELARESPGLRAIVVVTSDKCYENQEWFWGYREIDRVGGADPYAASKACAELVASCYRQAFFPPDSLAGHGVGIASARAGNVIGGGDWAPDRLVPDLIRSFHNNDVAAIRRPSSVRPWQHVLDCLSGYLILAQRLVQDPPVFSGSWNFGPIADDERAVAWVADRITQLWGEGAAWISVPDQGPPEATKLRLDCSKARTELGWRPTWDAEEAIIRTVRWYRSWSAGTRSPNLRDATDSDLSDFLREHSDS